MLSVAYEVMWLVIMKLTHPADKAVRPALANAANVPQTTPMLTSIVFTSRTSHCNVKLQTPLQITFSLRLLLRLVTSNTNKQSQLCFQLHFCYIKFQLSELMYTMCSFNVKHSRVARLSVFSENQHSG